MAVILLLPMIVFAVVTTTFLALDYATVSDAMTAVRTGGVTGVTGHALSFAQVYVLVNQVLPLTEMFVLALNMMVSSLFIETAGVSAMCYAKAIQ